MAEPLPQNHPLNQIAREYLQQVEALINRNSKWYQMAETALEAEFGKLQQAAMERGESIKHNIYHPDNTETQLSESEDFSQSLNNLHGVLSELLGGENPKDGEIYRQFADTAFDTLLALERFREQTISTGSEVFSDPPIESSEPNENNTTPIYKRLKNYLLSDQHVDMEADALGFKTYADTISGLLSESSTKPPLNIAILAPWGRGKTTLMRMVKTHFDNLRQTLLPKNSKGGPARLKDLRSWFRILTGKAPEPIEKDKVSHATIWFNPWNYQSTDMIFAGLANAIINQTVDQLPTAIAKEEFWFRLRFARMDKEKLRIQLHISIVYWALLGLGALGAIICLILYFKFPTHKEGTTFFGFISAGLAVFNGAMAYLKPNKESVAKSFTNLTQPPNYEQKLGIFHEVNEDVKQVLDMLVNPDKPPIVFVDDLDRCSPSKVVEVVEAINLFMSGDFNTKCYFVIGMDAEIVAAALDVAYEKMKGSIKRNESEMGSIGWYFLDKFIQLPFVIPVLDTAKKAKYLSSIMGENTSETDEKSERPKAATATELAAVLKTTTSDVERQNLIKNQDKKVVQAYDQIIIQEQITKTNDDPEIKEKVAEYAEFLGSDPRSLKRFANLLRFYGAYQYLRSTKGEPHVYIPTLAKWLAIMLRFPKMIRWLQWEDDAQIALQISPGEKAAMLDGWLQSAAKAPNAEAAFALWKNNKLITTADKDHPDGYPIADMKADHWIRSKVFFQLLCKNTDEKADFANALNCNVL